MSDLISKSELINALKVHFDSCFREDGELLYSDHICTSDDVVDLIKLVENQPIAYDIDKVVEELNQRKIKLLSYAEDYEKTGDFEQAEIYSHLAIEYTTAIEIVKQGDVSGDVCEWKFEETNGIAWHCDDKCTTYNQVYIKDLKITLEDFECKCPYCGKRIKVVE